MECPRCRTENKAGRHFCAACGGALPAGCPGCGFANDPADQFCGGCGRALGPSASSSDLRTAAPRAYTPRHLADKILISRGALEGERKQVTVLFVDVSGFTALSERLDPEDVHGLMTRAFALMLAEVHRYEGTVNQFLGDGIMALFGAPIAHEDHALRAVHAAIGIRRALDGYQDELRARGIRFQARQGLNTGLVVVGSIGSDLRMDYTAVGDTTNVAARLQQAADPGRIVVAEPTHRLVEGHVDARPLGELALKGKGEAIRAWEVIGARAARTRLEVKAERGLTPFVARERELHLLVDCFEKARAGQGQVAFVVGEPGIGKSRLLLELRRRLEGEATWLEGRCVSFGRSIAFHPLIDLLRRTFRIEEEDAEPAIVQKVEQGVLRLGEDLRPTLPFLRHLLSVDPGDPALLTMDPRERRSGVFDALRRLVVRAAQIRPQVLVVEDLHWIDQATEEYLRQCADSIPGNRILVILTYRPGYVHPLGEHTYHTHVALATLSASDSTELARTILDAEELPEELRALIARKAEGNPFFVEEVVKSLQEVGALRQVGRRWVLGRTLDQVLVPDTIQDVIMARIDRLDEAPKKTLQLASVIGREFTRRLLERITEIRERTEEFLGELKTIELIYEKSLFPELAYMFKHALTHEVAYGSILVQRRRELHRLIGRAIEELYRDRLAEHYEVLAHHFAKAEDWARALDYLGRAAEKAGRSFAVREALALYDQALEAAAHLGDAVPLETLRDIHQARSNHFFALGEYEESQREGERTLELARRAGDRTAEAAALAWTSFARMWAQDFEGALEYAGRATEVAGAVGAGAALGGGHLTTGYVHALSGRLDEARDGLDRAIAISRASGASARESLALQMAATVRSWQGDYRQAADLAAEGLRIAREHNLLIPLLRAFWAQGLVLGGGGEYDAALALLEEGLGLVEKVGDEAFIPRYLNTIGWVHGECEDRARAVEASRAAAERTRNWRHPVGVEMLAYSRINEGDVLLAMGDLDAARAVFDEMQAVVGNPRTHPWMRWRYSTHFFASQGELWLARGDATQARASADRCLEIAARTASRKYLVWGWRLRGESALRRRRLDDAGGALHEALAIARAIGNPVQLWRTHAAIGRLHAEAKRPDAAREAYRDACAVLDTLKARVRDRRLAAGLATSPPICEVYRLGADR